eukprot:Gb_08182 [translate_table: standard]
MSSFEDDQTPENLERNPNGGIRFPKSPPRTSDGSTSPPALFFSWSRMTADAREERESNSTSSGLWRPGSSAYFPNSSHPMSWRAQEIARGRQELMKLYEGMPESAYELSLKDLVEQKAAMEKLHQQMNSDGSQAKKGVKKKKAQRHDRRKISDTKSFLLNIFVPSSLTMTPHAASRSLSPNSSRIVHQNNDQSFMASPKESGKPEHHTKDVRPLSKIKPTHSSDVVSSNSFSKVSPRPECGKDGQTGVPFVCSPIDSKPKNSNRCSMCSGYTIFFKTKCQVCEKVYCSSCAKVAIVKTPEGRKCRVNCAGGSLNDRDFEPQLKSCFPFLSSNKVKSGRQTINSFSEEDRDWKSV